MRLTRFCALVSRARLASLAVLAAVVSCSTDELAGPTPPPPDASVLSALIAPEVGVEQPGFTFLAPLGTLQFKRPTGVFDQSLLSQLTVEICERAGNGCRLPLTRTFQVKAGLTMTGGLLGDAYQALWTVTSRTADQGKVYRIRVLRGQAELGYADLKVVSWLEILMNLGSVSGGGKVPLGSIVPIRFHVAKGAPPPAGTPVGPGGGTVQLAGGQATLEIPAGSVAAQTMITAVPATGLPSGGPPVVPGTAWDFGPDGTVFAQPVRMTIRYDPANLPPGTVESNLRIHKLVDGTYRQQGAGMVDLVNRTVSADVEGFSVYAVLERVEGAEQDVTPPVITAYQVFNPASGTWGSAVTLNASSGDAIARFRIVAQDDISGVRTAILSHRSPPSRPILNWACASESPVSGSDTQGVWECTLLFPQYSEPGAWLPGAVRVTDGAGHSASYSSPPGSGALCLVPSATPCLAWWPVVNLVSGPVDRTAPRAIGSIQVGLDSIEVDLDPTLEVVFGPSLTVDVADKPWRAIVRLSLTDDLSGFESPTGAPSVTFQREGGGGSFFGTCGRRGGVFTATFECPLFFPQSITTGTYYLASLGVQDRVGNRRAYTASPGSPLCDAASGECVASGPTIDVIRVGAP